MTKVMAVAALTAMALADEVEEFPAPVDEELTADLDPALGEGIDVDEETDEDWRSEDEEEDWEEQFEDPDEVDEAAMEEQFEEDEPEYTDTDTELRVHPY